MPFKHVLQRKEQRRVLYTCTLDRFVGISDLRFKRLYVCRHNGPGQGTSGGWNYIHYYE